MIPHIKCNECLLQHTTHAGDMNYIKRAEVRDGVVEREHYLKAYTLWCGSFVLKERSNSGPATFNSNARPPRLNARSQINTPSARTKQTHADSIPNAYYCQHIHTRL